jgi:hypothetical protein
VSFAPVLRTIARRFTRGRQSFVTCTRGGFRAPGGVAVQIRRVAPGLSRAVPLARGFAGEGEIEPGFGQRRVESNRMFRRKERDLGVVRGLVLCRRHPRHGIGTRVFPASRDIDEISCREIAPNPCILGVRRHGALQCLNGLVLASLDHVRNAKRVESLGRHLRIRWLQLGALRNLVDGDADIDRK